jgi:hypothetical protein
MSAQDAFQTLKNYFENRVASRQVIGCLKPGVEIGINIGDQIDCALFAKDGLVVVEERAAQSPDFIFSIRPESVYVLNNQPSEDVPDIAIAVLKEMLAGNISVRFLGNLGAIAKNGYMDILKLGGSRVMSFLTMHGMIGVSTLMSSIKKMRN